MNGVTEWDLWVYPAVGVDGWRGAGRTTDPDGNPITKYERATSFEFVPSTGGLLIEYRMANGGAAKTYLPDGTFSFWSAKEMVAEDAAPPEGAPSEDEVGISRDPATGEILWRWNGRRWVKLA